MIFGLQRLKHTLFRSIITYLVEGIEPRITWLKRCKADAWWPDAKDLLPLDLSLNELSPNAHYR